MPANKLAPGLGFHLEGDGKWDVQKIPPDVLRSAKFIGELEIEGFPSVVFEKTCSLCRHSKPSSCFSRWSKSKDGLDSRCKDCKSGVFRSWRSDPGNKSRHKLTTRANRTSIKLFIDGLKSGSCKDCSRLFPGEPHLMEFDHVSEKIISVSMLQKQRWSRAKILREVGKCDLVCVLCHRRRTKARLTRSSTSRAQARIREMRAFVDGLKEAPCTDCGLSHPSECMDFDHLGGKVDSISMLVGKGRSRQFILEEIQKCELICALCHSRRTHSRRVTDVRS